MGIVGSTVSITAHCLIGKYVNCDTDCNEDEESTEDPMLCNPDGAVQQGNPKSRDRHDLDMERNGFMHHEIGYVAAKMRMVEQPVVKFPVAAKKQGCR